MRRDELSPGYKFARLQSGTEDIAVNPHAVVYVRKRSESVLLKFEDHTLLVQEPFEDVVDALEVASRG